MWVECFFKWRRPTSEKIVRTTASSDASSYFYPNLETTLKKVILSPWAFREYDLTKKTIIKTKTVKMTFREYLQRVNLETLTFYRDKDIWNTLRCFFKYLCNVPHPSYYSNISDARLFKKSCYWWKVRALVKSRFLCLICFHFHPHSSYYWGRNLLLLQLQPPSPSRPVLETIPRFYHQGSQPLLFGRKSKAF